MVWLKMQQTVNVALHQLGKRKAMLFYIAVKTLRISFPQNYRPFRSYAGNWGEVQSNTLKPGL